MLTTNKYIIYIYICETSTSSSIRTHHHHHHHQLGVEFGKSKNNFHPINKKRKENNQPERKCLSQNHQKKNKFYATKNTFPKHHKSMPQKKTPFLNINRSTTLDFGHQTPFQQTSTSLSTVVWVDTNWLVVEPTHLKNMLVKMGSSSPIFGVNIPKNI